LTKEEEQNHSEAKMALFSRGRESSIQESKERSISPDILLARQRTKQLDQPPMIEDWKQWSVLDCEQRLKNPDE
jgi:hypothetical protein